MGALINSYRFAGSSTPTLDTAASYWIAKNTATYYDSGNDRLSDQAGSNNLQLGSTSSGDANDPTFGNDGTYEHLAVASGDGLKTLASLTLSGTFTIVIAATLDSGAGANTRLIHNGFHVYFTGSDPYTMTGFGFPGSSPGGVSAAGGSPKGWSLVNGAGASSLYFRADGSNGTKVTGGGFSNQSLNFMSRTNWTDSVPGKFNGAAVFASALSDAQVDDAVSEILSLAVL